MSVGEPVSYTMADQPAFTRPTLIAWLPPAMSVFATAVSAVVVVISYQPAERVSIMVSASLPAPHPF